MLFVANGRSAGRRHGADAGTLRLFEPGERRLDLPRHSTVRGRCGDLHAPLARRIEGCVRRRRRRRSRPSRRRPGAVVKMRASDTPFDVARLTLTARRPGGTVLRQRKNSADGDALDELPRLRHQAHRKPIVSARDELLRQRVWRDVLYSRCARRRPGGCRRRSRGRRGGAVSSSPSDPHPASSAPPADAAASRAGIRGGPASASQHRRPRRQSLIAPVHASGSRAHPKLRPPRGQPMWRAGGRRNICYDVPDSIARASILLRREDVRPRSPTFANRSGPVSMSKSVG